MANSSNVTASDLVLYSQYCNLRKDVLDTSTGHGHTGATDDGKKLSGNVIGGSINFAGYAIGSPGSISGTPEFSGTPILGSVGGTPNFSAMVIPGTIGLIESGSPDRIHAGTYVYKNTSGKLRLYNFTMILNGGSESCSVLVGPGSPPGNQVGRIANYNSELTEATISAIVPNNWYFRVAPQGGTPLVDTAWFNIG